MVFILNFLSKSIPLGTLDQMYKMYIRPLFDYGDIIYHIPHNYNLFDSSISLNSLMEKVENVQYQAALAVSGCWQGSNRSKLYELFG